MKKMLLALVSAALVFAFVLPNLYAASCPADMVLKVPDNVKAKQSPVKFSHAKHGKLDCKACHHKWDGKGEPGGCANKGCHDQYEAADKKAPAYFYNAFHSKTNKSSCLGCHADLKKAAKATGPINCTDCHPKK